MYENNIYSGSDAGSNTTGSYDANSTEHNTGLEANTTNSSYQSYGIYQTDPADSGFGAGEPKKEPNKKKTGGYLRKAMLSMSLGLFFGLFAGIGFYAVMQTVDLTNNNEETVLSQNVENENSNTEASQSGIKLADASEITVVSSDISEVVEEVMPAMVSIVNTYTATGNYFGQNYSQESAASGSGIIVAESDTELLIATNYHVIEGADKLDVYFIDGTTAEAQLKGSDSDMDLAVIAIPLDYLTEETKNAISIATLGDSDSLKLGEPVIAIGNALGYGQSVTNGIVSALNREIALEDGTSGTFIQTNAAINPGNSGGALLNMNGEVIGINSNKIGGTVVEGMGYAIPISAAKPIITELMMKQTRVKVDESQIGYIGISLQTLTDQFASMYRMPQGIYVTAVEDNSPAQQAGILSGDIIVKFDGDKITSYEDLQEVLQYYSAGSTVIITVQRPQNGEYASIDLSLTLGEKPAGN